MEDKRRYLIALGAKRPFEKEYTIFHETIEVRFRSLGQRELDELTLWAAKSVRNEKAFPSQEIKTRIRHQEMLGSLVLQTRLLRSLVEDAELFWASPETPYPTWDDWKKEFDIDAMDRYRSAHEDVTRLLGYLRELDITENETRRPAKNEYDALIEFWGRVFGDPDEMERKQLARDTAVGVGETEEAQLIRERQEYVRNRFLRR